MEEKGEVKEYELQLKRKDGSLLWVSMNARAVRDKAGKTLYYEGLAVDITARKKSEEKLRESLESLRRAMRTTIQVMVAAVETRDPYTAGHQKRVTELARALAQEMGLPKDTIEGIRMAGSIHDLGKISVPAEILSKPTQLSEPEFALIKTHSQSGYEILKDVESPWPLAEIVLQHHERLDGSGYPQGLKGEAILLEARILAVADVVESISSHRPYRPAYGIAEALKEIEQNAGVLYDREVVEAALRLFRKKGFNFTLV
jgi:HD-GYP domain-containing protein (c-di-GMP phosphodiesterase class II)